ncbi:uncharacterized protein LOC114477607 [Gouania willdenowi]|uniref:uncharacterized protein LOC114477607 n=1 Tax=Gouania willdenowi TaxID=441366 RepID=UPI0010551189|nr:uncharacterized protein LOC114477607 [Gouania willdenowi]
MCCFQGRLMASCVVDWVNVFVSISLSTTALHSSYKLFKEHRAPSVGLFMLGLSAALCVFDSSSSNSLQREAEWAAKVLAPALVSFDFLWLSKDPSTAFILLSGSCLLIGLTDWLSSDSLTVMTRCLGLSSLSCCLTVCLFAGNALGAVGGVALTLPLLMTPSVGVNVSTPIISPTAADGLLKCLLNGTLSLGCWASRLALSRFLQDVTEHCHISL